MSEQRAIDDDAVVLAVLAAGIGAGGLDLDDQLGVERSVEHRPALAVPERRTDLGTNFGACLFLPAVVVHVDVAEDSDPDVVLRGALSR